MVSSASDKMGWLNDLLTRVRRGTKKCTTCVAFSGLAPQGRFLVEATCPIYEQPTEEGPYGQQDTGDPVRVGEVRRRYILSRSEQRGFENVKVIAEPEIKQVWCALHQDWRADHETCDSYQAQVHLQVVR